MVRLADNFNYRRIKGILDGLETERIQSNLASKGEGVLAFFKPNVFLFLRQNTIFKLNREIFNI